MSNVGQNTEFHIDNASGVLTDLSEYCTSVAPTFNVSLHDVTPYGESWRKFIAGLKDGTCAVNLFAEATTDLHMFGIMGVQVSVRIDPYGVATGETRISFEAFLQSWALADPVDGAVTKTVNLQITGAATVAAQS